MTIISHAQLHRPLYRHTEPMRATVEELLVTMLSGREPLFVYSCGTTRSWERRRIEQTGTRPKIV